jgi:hypothetical protein
MNAPEIDLVKAAAVTPEEHHLRSIETLRVSLDSVLQCIHRVQARQGSREIALSVTKVQEGSMWLGAELKRCGGTLPYPNSYKPENATVDPTADGLKL